MGNPKKWFNRIENTLEQYENRLGPKEYRKYQVDLLLRMTRRVADYSLDCTDCQSFQDSVGTMTEDLGTLPAMAKEKSQNYRKTQNALLKHLRRKHHLVVPGEYTSTWMSAGMAVGAGIGSIYYDLMVGLGGGLVAGTALGIYLDRRARNLGRVI
jgi:hypothetical protein